MASLSEIARERKKTLKEILAKSATLDRQQEILERWLKSLLKRRKQVPEPSDLKKAMGYYNTMVAAATELSKALQKGFIQ